MSEPNSNARIRTPNLLAVAGLALAVLLIAMAISYATRKPAFPPEAEALPVSVAPDEDAERMYTALTEGRAMDAFKYAISLNTLSVTGNANMVTAMNYATGALDQYREDHCKAAVWYDRAARFRQVMPAIYMSVIYMSGQGVKRDTEAAYFWFLQARRLANTYPVGQWPAWDWSRYIQGLELALEAKIPEIRDPELRAQLDEKLKYRTVEEQPAATPQPVPDIPIFAEVIGQIMYGSRGCHGPEANAFGWFNSQFNAERLGFKPTPNSNVGNVAGLNVQF